MNNIIDKASTRRKSCEKSTGITYNICKKDGSNYSVRKTILTQSKNRDHQCTMCPLDKSKLVVNTLIELKYWIIGNSALINVLFYSTNIC